MEITGVGILVMDGDGTLVLDGIIGTETIGTEIIGVGIVGMETTGAGITGMVIIGDIQITTTIEPIPITQAEEVLLILPIQVAIEITVPEVQQITLETRAIPLVAELIQITEEIRILISEEVLQTDSIELVQHFQEIKTIPTVHLAEDQIQVAHVVKTTLLQDHILQVQETITIPDHTLLAQIVREILVVAVDHLEVAEEVAEDNNSFYTFLF
jgi:hypothetical protein